MGWLAEKLIDLRVVALLSLAAFAMVILAEHDYRTLPFVFFVFCAVAGLILLASRRVAFSLLTAWALFAVITAISAAKRIFMGPALHAFDAYFYDRDLEVLSFLSNSYAVPELACAGVFLFGVLVCFLVFRRESKTSFHRAKIFASFVACLAGTYVCFPAAADTPEFFYTNYHLTSSFFASLRDARYLFMPTQFAEELSSVAENAAYDGVADCAAQKARPDVIVVLMESAVPPSLYPEVKAPAQLDRLFQSADERINPMRVETFGGGTWITTTGLFTSLPTTKFGWMRPYLPLYLQGRMHHSLPKLLKSCGYKTAVISPLPYPFVNEGPFMTSLGIEDYRDAKSIGAKSKQERDTFYFDTALAYIANHHKTDGRPLFLYIMTMAAHGPYNFRFDPDAKVAGEPFGNGGEMDEYLRRLTMQQSDFKDFAAKLAGVTAREGAIVVDFGDHQPSVTRPLAEQAESADALGHWDSIAYRTYYNITAINRKLAAPLPDVPSLDITYLAPTLLQAAGLPLDDVYTQLIGLRDRCKGAFMLCPQRGPIEAHLKKLINGGLLDVGTAKDESHRQPYAALPAAAGAAGN
jgi:phosphoglycerol transferase MdoB-like AlkP superfamily enzyme